MATWVVLLRAVNVGGRKLAMADLRAVIGSLGHTDVATYIQSGNAVMTTSRSDRVRLAEEIESEIERLHDIPVSVILRTPGELRKVLELNPFSDIVETARVVVTFLSAKPQADAAARLEPERFAPDRFVLLGSELYMHYPSGIGTSKMTLDYFENRLGVRGTARNLNTVNKLIELAGG